MSQPGNALTRQKRSMLWVIPLLAFPYLPGTTGLLGSAAQVGVFTIVAASLVLLTGWVGQISLAQAAFVGVGAYATGWAAGTFGIGFPLTLPVAALVAAAMAALVGVVALRVRGLYLAVATLIFAWACSEYLFRQPWVLEHSDVPAQAIGQPGMLFHLDFSSRQVHYYVVWIVALGVLFGLANLRDSKTGRAFFAVRGSEMAAASLGMDVLRYKSLAFGLSGALAGIAGNLTMTHNKVVSPDSFDFNGSLFFLAIAVVGGLSSLPGAIAAAVVFATMSELFFQVPFLNQYLELFSAVLLAVVFRAYPGGLASLGNQVASLLQDWKARLLEPPPPAPVPPRGAEEDQDLIDRLSRRIKRRVPQPRLVLMRLVTGVAAVRRPQRAAYEILDLDDPQPATGPGPDLDPGLDAGLDADLAEGAPIEPVSPSTNGHHEIADDGLVTTSFPTDRRVHESDDDTMELPTAPRRRLVRLPDGVSPTPGAASSTAPAGLDHDRARSGDIATPAAAVGSLPPRADTEPLIEAVGVTMRFGGLTAVNDASLEVRHGEITGLIGPNGAGKTTLFNTVAGFLTPTEGRIRLHGQDVTEVSVHGRAQLGVARTFQLIQLFPQLTVFDNLLAATHLQNPTGFAQHLMVSTGALHAEVAARRRVARVIELLELGDVAQRPVAGLPFGVLRMVEVGRALVTGAKLIMLDEPASGLDERETDRLMQQLRLVRDLGATLLLIEHDIRMVTAISDYLYVLNRGEIIAHGHPTAIQANPEVIAAYLGTSATGDPGPAGPHPSAGQGPAVGESVEADDYEEAQI